MSRIAGAALLGVGLLLAGPAAAQPDLEMVWWTPSPTTVQGAGDTITINYGVWNSGDAACGNFYLGFYYGDSTATTNLTLAGQAYLPGMVDGESGYYTSVITVPSAALKGARYLHYFIDNQGTVSESDETNNRGHVALTVTGDPDVQVNVLSVTPTTAAPGQTVNVTYRLENTGKTRAGVPFYLRFYHSPNSSITTSDTYLNKEVTVSSLLAGGYYPPGANGSVSVTLPGSVPTGSGYVGAIADYSNLINESAENNNTKATPITVAAPAELSMQSWSTNVSSVPGAGSQVQVTFQVQNTGGGAAGPFVVRFYYGDASASTGLTSLGEQSISGLAGGSNTGSLTRSVTLPASVLHGTRYLHYFIDADAQVGESDETNNRGSRTLAITGRPDLQLSNLAISPTSAVPGQSLTVSYRLKNAGLSRLPATFYTRLYYSPDSTISAGDTYLGQQIAVTSLLAGAQYPAASDGSATVTLPGGIQQGTHYVGGVADYNNTVTESVETNNTTAAPVLVVGANGTPCAVPAQCASKNCVDGVCCNTPCGAGVSTDCQACSTAAGAPGNGICSLLPATTQCRAAAGPCDLAESCSGSAPACPTNVFKPASTTCRAAAGPCDLAESCSGSSAACPADSFKSAGAVCRAATGECDLAEQCAGNTAACPADLFKPNNLPCSGGVCSSGSCVPVPDSGVVPDSAVPPDAGADAGADAGPEAGPADAAPGDSAGDDGSADGAPPDGAPPDGSFVPTDVTTVDSSSVMDVPAAVEGGPDGDGGGDGAVYNPPELDEGCSCALTAAPPRGSAPLVLLLLALVLLRRRGLSG